MEVLVESPPQEGFGVWRDEVAVLVEESPLDLRQRFVEAEARLRRAVAEQAVLIGEMERLELYREDGHASIFGMLRSGPHWSEAECRSRTKLARLVADYPTMAESLWEGRISVANAESIARLYSNPRVRDRFEGIIGELLGEAERREHDDFRLIVGRWELLVDAGSRAERAAAPRRSSFDRRR